MRQVLQKLKYALIFPLVLAESLIVHEQVYNIAVAVKLANPLRIFRSCQWIILPAFFREPESYVIAQPVILQEQPDIFCSLRSIYKIRASPSKDMVCPFCKNAR